MQFFICFHMLFKVRPMINYESMSKLLHFLDVKDFPKTHQLNIVVWEMALACMIWLLTKPNLWLKVLGSSLFLVMKSQLLINSLGFPSCLCVGRLANLCCYPCSMWLTGPLLITRNGYQWMPICCLVICVRKQLHIN